MLASLVAYQSNFNQLSWEQKLALLAEAGAVSITKIKPKGVLFSFNYKYKGSKNTYYILFNSEANKAATTKHPADAFKGNERKMIKKQADFLEQLYKCEKIQDMPKELKTMLEARKRKFLTLTGGNEKDAMKKFPPTANLADVIAKVENASIQPDSEIKALLNDEQKLNNQNALKSYQKIIALRNVIGKKAKSAIDKSTKFDSIGYHLSAVAISTLKKDILPYYSEKIRNNEYMSGIKENEIAKMKKDFEKLEKTIGEMANYFRADINKEKEMEKNWNFYDLKGEFPKIWKMYTDFEKKYDAWFKV